MGRDFEVEQAEQSPESVPLLALWRTWLPREAERAAAERLEGALVARCRTVMADEDHNGWAGLYAVLVEAAEMRDPMAWLELAGVIHLLFDYPDDEMARDLKGSCLWLAARLRLHWASLMLLVTLAEAASGDAAIAPRLRICQSWNQRSSRRCAGLSQPVACRPGNWRRWCAGYWPAPYPPPP